MMFSYPISKLPVISGLIIILATTFHVAHRFQQKTDQATGGVQATVIRFEQFSTGFTVISNLEFADDGRLFVAETAGRVRIVEVDGTVNPTLFLDIQDKVGNIGEQGLSGFVLHPQFESNGVFYVNYTSPDSITYISRFHTMATDPNQADPNSEEILLSVMQPSPIHNGAEMKFGPDGYLYIGMGDGGHFNDPSNNGQNGNTILGTILRIDVNGSFPYEIPPDNPFIGDPDVLDEIWAMGLRNPWRFDFDDLTKDLYLTDVGEGQWEEINFEPVGSGGGFNYGWRCYEGFEPYITIGCGPSENYTFPVHVESHYNMCAIIGGYVYRGSLYPMIDGHFLFADYCNRRVWGLLHQPDGSFSIASTGRMDNGSITTFGEDPDGELYIANFANIYRISAEIITLTPQMYIPVLRHDG